MAGKNKEKRVVGETEERGAITLCPKVHDSTKLHEKLQDGLQKKKNGRSAKRLDGGGTNQIQFTERSMDWLLCFLSLSVEHM